MKNTNESDCFLQNGKASAIPNAAAYFAVVLSGILADWLQTSGMCTTVVVRKVFTTIGKCIVQFSALFSKDSIILWAC